MAPEKALPRRGPRLSDEAFARLVEQAVDRLPPVIRRHLEGVLISILPRPSREMLAEVGLAEDEPLFGLYRGVPLIERSPLEPVLYPDTIHIFQEPLEEWCRSREELLTEIEITVVHEVAHFVGFGEEEIAALGYG